MLLINNLPAAPTPRRRRVGHVTPCAPPLPTANRAEADGSGPKRAEADETDPATQYVLKTSWSALARSAATALFGARSQIHITAIFQRTTTARIKRTGPNCDSTPKNSEAPPSINHQPTTLNHSQPPAQPGICARPLLASTATKICPFGKCATELFIFVRSIQKMKNRKSPYPL